MGDDPLKEGFFTLDQERLALLVRLSPANGRGYREQAEEKT
jgi:hypothetical protein